LTPHFYNPVLPFGDGVTSIFVTFLQRSPWGVYVVRKISLALVLMAMAGVASASSGGSSSCFQILWFTFCPAPIHPPVQAPEIDPASAMAGLTMLAGGLAVLRGRRKDSKKE
jgi:hypothetical protein